MNNYARIDQDSVMTSWVIIRGKCCEQSLSSFHFSEDTRIAIVTFWKGLAILL